VPIVLKSGSSTFWIFQGLSSSVQELLYFYLYIEYLVAKICTRLKKIIRFQKRRPQWDLEKLHTQKQTVQDTLEWKLGATECNSENVEVQWNKIKEVS
jgi:hypothetical protein